jgi:hypothetical protein
VGEEQRKRIVVAGIAIKNHFFHKISFNGEIVS